MATANPQQVLGTSQVAFDPNAPQPNIPNYVVGYDPSTMSLSDYLAGKYDSSGLKAFQSEALRKGPSAWANLATQDQAVQAGAARENAAGQTNSQTSQAMDDLASRGGLSSGARERATTEGAKNYLSMSQDLGRQENLNKLQIGMNDQQNKIQELSALPGMQQQQAQMYTSAKQADIASTVAENANRNNYNQSTYGTQMAGWAANQQANATAKSGKK